MSSDLLRKLLSIQEVDTRLLQIKRRFKEVDAEIKRAGNLGKLSKQLEESKAKELENQLQIARAQSQKTDLQERIAELDKRLFSGLITNVREMKAVEFEQAELKRQLEQIEDSRVPLELELTSSKEEVTDLKLRVEEASKEWESQKVELEKQLMEHAKEYKKLQKKQQTQLENVPNKSHIRLYRDTFRRMHGVAIVKVERGFCSGCNLSLPQGGKGIQYSGNLPRCPNCSRFIMFD